MTVIRVRAPAVGPRPRRAANRVDRPYRVLGAFNWEMGLRSVWRKALFCFAVAHSLRECSSLMADPVADPAAIVISPCGARFTVLSSRLIRAERAFRDKPAVFDDRATFAVINRKRTVPPFHVEHNPTGLTLTTSEVRLVHRCESSDDTPGPGFGSGELSLTLLTTPFTKWETTGSPARSGSSVAHIVREAMNLNVR
jgi:hypothetical protein